MRTPALPRPEDFDDYRLYLEARINYLRQTERGFSYRKLARRGGITSPGLIHDVLKGRRELAPSVVQKLAKALKLSAQETDALEALVLLGRAKDDTERNRHFARLQRNARPGKQSQLTQAQYDIYSHWYALAVRELLLLPDFEENPGWIAKRLRPRIRPSEARKALELIERVGLAVRGEDGRLRPADTTITTPATVQSLAARNYHRAMLDIASESLEKVSQAERNITSLNVPLTKDIYDEICRRIMEFQDEILVLSEKSVAEAGKGKPCEIYWIGFDVIPLSKKEGDEES